MSSLLTRVYLIIRGTGFGGGVNVHYVHPAPGFFASHVNWQATVLAIHFKGYHCNATLSYFLNYFTTELMDQI